MTTAHRPTFDPARGKEAARGEAYHQRLLPAHKTLKFRQATQGNPSEQAKRDLKAELLRNEAKHFARKSGKDITDEDDADIGGPAELPMDRRKRIEDGANDDDADAGVAKRRLGEGDGGGGLGDEGEAEEDYEVKKRRILAETKDIDADSASSESSSSNSEDEEESEDETAELMRELAKIRAERAEKAAADAAAQAQKEQEQREKDIAYGNPLLNPTKEEYGVKRRWDDDVVFKNQARGTEDKGKEKRFVNDLLRSDFHRRFMDKYVR